MKQSHLFGTLCFCVFTVISSSSNAALVDRGGGLIYDSDQDLTWTQDAGLSGFRSSWDDATAWAENLVFGSVGGWRLPTTTQFDDPTCSGDVRGDLFFEHRLDCLGGEMERLTAAADPWTNTLFENLNRTRYWTATLYRDGVDPCIGFPDAYDVECNLLNDDGDRTGFYWQWGFTGFGGINGPAYKTTLKGTNDRYAWAVHDGDVGGAPLLPGDINFDGQVNIADYLLLTQFVLGIRFTPTATELNAGDMNGNGQLDVGDLVIHSRTIMGQI